MFNLKDTSQTSELDSFWSHPDKPLRVHTNGVLSGVVQRGGSIVGQIAALFHDLGKLNPNFQPKLKGQAVTGYDHHAYLSALCFLSYCSRNPRITDLGISSAQVFSILAIIAHHHGHLPELRDIFSVSERDRLFEFLATQPDLPVSRYLAQWLDHQEFDVFQPNNRALWEKFGGLTDTYLKDVNPLDFWLSTQYDFACLIESDKRDAGNLKSFKRAEQIVWAQSGFSSGLKKTFDALIPDNELNKVRQQMREEAVTAIAQPLAQGRRVFTLTAPTGAGKTYMLLALANEIRKRYSDLGVIYGLPFLAITEQVESVCHQLWATNPDFVTRVDSRTLNERLETLLEQVEARPELADEILAEQFSAQTFDAAFVVTTFVQIFESLLSNRNATLLKLPNFAHTIFLLDEIQALPPRLYIFLTAYLDAFCRCFDCYAVLSTATMPHLELGDRPNAPAKQQPNRLFGGYQNPVELLDYSRHFKEPVFNRYRIEPIGDLTIARLADAVEPESESCLIILNTIQDTKDLFAELTRERYLSGVEIVLLNTHFTPSDRRAKIQQCKDALNEGQRVVLVSTQLIEAGVDIDFPIVYRDLCPLPNLIQSAGRCNRNGKRTQGKVVFFTLRDDDNKRRADKIYRHPADQSLLKQTQEALSQKIVEADLLETQRAFFQRMADNFAIGDHSLWKDKERLKNANLIEYIADFNFPVVGTFALIDEQEFGKEHRIYIPEDEADQNWEQLAALRVGIAKAHARGAKSSEIRLLSIKLDTHLRAMNERVVAVRCKENQMPPLAKRNNAAWEMCGMFKLLFADTDYYEDQGIRLNGEATAIL